MNHRFFSILLSVSVSVLAGAPCIALAQENFPPADLVLEPAGDFETHLAFGEQTTLSPVLSNRNATLGTDWEILFEKGRVSLEDSIDMVNDNADSLTGAIPYRFPFPRGETGWAIAGNGTMYQYTNGGNHIYLGDERLNYSNDVITEIDVASDGHARYFTHKFSGLFLFSAELHNNPGLLYPGVSQSDIVPKNALG